MNRGSHLGWCLAASFALIAAAGCAGANATTAATATTVTRTSDTFTGTVAIGGRDVHTFSVAAEGPLDVTLTTVTPASTTVMGLSVGIPADATCAALPGASTQSIAGSVAQLSGIVTAGTLCVDVHDVGTLSTPVDYTLTVIHP